MKLTHANQQSIAKYAKCAGTYDASCGPTWHIRQKTIDYLRLRAGDVVLDIGCGTGMSFEPLLDRVGASGCVLACEQSPEMFALAQQRIARHGWRNVHVVNTNAEHYQIAPGGPAPDAVLMHYVHDIARTDVAVNNLLSQLRPGTRLSMAGMKNFTGVLRCLNWLAYLKNAPYNALAHDMEMPWDKVQHHASNWVVEPTQWGMGYIAHGQRSP